MGPFWLLRRAHGPGAPAEAYRRCEQTGATERGYDTLWDRFRDWFLRQPGNQVCAICKKNMARVVHHIVPVEERPDLRLEPKNCQALCRECHERLHGRRA